MDVELKPLTRADTPAWAELLAACEKVDQVGENYDADDLAEEFDDPERDAARDFAGIWRDGQLVGAAAVHPRHEATDVHRVVVEGETHPTHRGTGIGTALLDWGLVRAREAHGERFPDVPGEVLAYGGIDNDAKRDLLASAGFTPQRWFATMERDLAAPVAAWELPGDLDVLGYDDSEPEAVRDAHNEAFRDHWGSTPRSASEWKLHVDDTKNFRPAMSRVAVDRAQPGVVAGYVIMYEYDADTEATGVREAYVGTVGVRRAWRQRGLASALLGAVLEASQQDGYQCAALDVDSDSPTGAFRVYERLGFEVTKRSIAYVLPI